MKNLNKLKLSLLFVSIFLTSCGYQFVSVEKNTPDFKGDIFIPYVTADLDGVFTKELIRALLKKNIPIGNSRSRYILNAKLLNTDKEYIGYEYDKNSEELIPNEARINITVEISLVDSLEQRTLWGPILISTATVYDFFSSSEKIGKKEHKFTCGQLENESLANDVASEVLLKELALRTADCLSFKMKQQND